MAESHHPMDACTICTEFGFRIHTRRQGDYNIPAPQRRNSRSVELLPNGPLIFTKSACI
jgi:hypothetical protein